MYLAFANITIYIINQKVSKAFEEIGHPFHSVSNIWEWDEK